MPDLSPTPLTREDFEKLAPEDQQSLVQTGSLPTSTEGGLIGWLNKYMSDVGQPDAVPITKEDFDKLPPEQQEITMRTGRAPKKPVNDPPNPLLMVSGWPIAAAGALEAVGANPNVPNSIADYGSALLKTVRSAKDKYEELPKLARRGIEFGLAGLGIKKIFGE